MDLIFREGKLDDLERVVELIEQSHEGFKLPL